MESICIHLEFNVDRVVVDFVFPSQTQRERETHEDSISVCCISFVLVDMVGTDVLQFGIGFYSSIDCHVVFGKTDSADQEKMAARISFVPGINSCVSCLAHHLVESPAEFARQQCAVWENCAARR